MTHAIKHSLRIRDSVKVFGLKSGLAARLVVSLDGMPGSLPACGRARRRRARTVGCMRPHRILDSRLLTMLAKPATSSRLALVDVLRGLAVAQMIVFHFIYDLNHFGWLHLRMLVDQPWVGWRTAIVTQFLLLVGVGLTLRTSFKPALGDFVHRWLQIAAAALLVTIGSWLAFGPRFIYFGVLHFVAAALLLARPLLALGPWNLALGVAAVAAGLLFSDPWFNPAPVNVLGFVAAKPRTEDYVPIFPWLGVVLIGCGLGALWRRSGWAMPQLLARLNKEPPHLLLWLGVWSLTVYLVHQPLLLGVLALARKAGL
jgi:uncharacterized membrane protein